MSTNLTVQEAQRQIKSVLETRGCTDILLSEPTDGHIIATFNCKELTSFNQPITGWSYSGTQLDPAGQRQYKIDFRRN